MSSPRPRSRATVALVTLLTALLAGLLLAGCASDPDAPDPSAEGVRHLDAAAGVDVVVHRTEACGCCGEYEAVLEEAGFVVERRVHEDLAAVKDGFGIPHGERSCHTSELAGYRAEGHIPVAALLDLIEQAPDVDGISLAGMPAGSPGMPGTQEEPFHVSSFVDGEVVGVFGTY